MADNLDINTVHKELAKEDFIVFAGTGVVHGTGVPSSWDELLEALGEEAGIDIKAKGNYLVVEGKERRKDECPDIAQEIYDRLSTQGNEKKYLKMIKEKLRPTIIPYAPLAREIIKTTKWIVTTNFDYTVEEAFKEMKCDPNVWTLPNFEHEFQEYTLSYLHGNTLRPEIIFKKDEYDFYYPSVSGMNRPRNLENYLEFIYGHPYTLIFIGCGFNDKYLTICLEKIYERLTMLNDKISKSQDFEKIPKPGPHYAFLLEPQEHHYETEKEYEAVYQAHEKLKRDLALINIKVVGMKNYIDWIICFKRIQEEKQRRKPLSVQIEKSETITQIILKYLRRIGRQYYFLIFWKSKKL
jgi:hypothetical protein